MNGSNCPEMQRLADFTSGKLPEEEASSVSQHVAECATCEATVQSLETKSDTLASGLRDAPPKEPYVDEPGYRQAVSELNKLPAGGRPKSPAQPAANPADASQPTSPPSPAQKTSISAAAQGPQKAAAKPADKPAPKLGPYKLLAKLGEGGMGAVYKALHEHLGKTVAIKVLPKKAMQDQAAVARFRREMKAVGALHHPNIVGAHDAGEAQGVHFLVMEYVEGSDLSGLVKKQGPLPVEKAISYIRQAACGLAFAHGKGVVHRDIKPANLLVDTEGTLKILDMGLARLDDGDPAAREGLTQTGQVMGTVDYMAPEQAFDTHTADGKADVYSLGCTLYRILTGQNMFTADTLVQKILAHREAAIPALGKVRPDAPPQLDALYQRMVAKKPEQRPTMAEVASELEALAKPQGAAPASAPALDVVIDTGKADSGKRKAASVTPAANPERQRREPAPSKSAPSKPPRSPNVKWIAAAAGAAAILFTGIWIIVRGDKGEELSRTYVPDGKSVEVVNGGPNLAPSSPSGKSDGTAIPRKTTVVTPTLSRDGGYSLSFDDKSVVEVPSLKLDPAGPLTIEVFITPRAVPELFQHLIGVEKQFDLSINQGGHWGVSIAPTKDRNGVPVSTKTMVEVDRRAHLAGVRSGPTLQLFVNGRKVGSAPTENQLLPDPSKPFTLGGKIFGLIDEVRVSRSVRYTKDFTPQQRFEPDADTTALYHFDEGTGDVLHDASGNKHDGKIVGAKWVRVGSMEPEAASAVASWGTLLHECQGHTGGVWCADISADGLVAVSGGGGEYVNGRYDFKGGRDYDVRIWDTRSGVELARLAGHLDTVRSVAITPDARYVLSASWDRSIRLWDVQERKEIKRFTGHAESLTGAAFIPGADRIVSTSTDGTLRIWDRSTAGQLHSFALGMGQLHGVAVSPDGRWAYCGTQNKSIQIVDLTNGKISGELAGLSGLIHSVSVSQDGLLIAAANGNVPGCSGAVWEAVGGKRRFQFSGHVAQFVTGGQQLVVGGENGELHLLDTIDGRILHQVTGHSKVTQGVAVSKDGQVVLSGSWDGTVKLWSGIARVPSSPPQAVPPVAVAPFDAAQAKAHQEAWAKHLGTTVETTNSVGAKMVLIPPGEFLMGSNDEQIAAALRVADEAQTDQATMDRIKTAERPQHRVVITKPFWMGATEVTVGQFKRFGASGYQTEAERAVDQPQAATYLSPGYAVTDDSPAAVITWDDAVAYCNWLSTQEQQKPCYRLEGTRWLVVPGQSGYRLPTEAEWEYACRAGSTSQYSFGDDQRQLGQHGWYQMNADRRPHAVGTRPPNGFGLFDLHGNVQEWCQDFWDEGWYASSPSDDPTGPVSRFTRVLRGGAWTANVSGCRAASRNNNVPSTRYGHYGFRVVRVLDAPATTASITPQPAVPTAPPVTKPTGPAPPLAKAPFDAAQARAHQEAWARHLGTTVEMTNSVGAKMILIPPGEFLMGSTDEQVAAALKDAETIKADQVWKDHLQTSERPQHRVIITKPFRMGATEVTVGQFKKFAAATGYQTSVEKAAKDPQPPPYLNPGYDVTDDSPAAAITWDDAAAYCKWLSDQEKTTYRLPTEAEWEYACRAGTTTRYSFGDDVALLPQYSWQGQSGRQSHAVGTKLPNGFGLFDMHGNLREWCGDFYVENGYGAAPQSDPTGPAAPSAKGGRVMRGGDIFEFWCHSAYRSGDTATNRRNMNGFRIVRVLDAPATTASVTPLAGPALFDLLTDDENWQWSEPANLGPTVNSKFSDDSPSIAGDGLELVFYSDRPGGHGQWDLWISRRASISEPFSAPENLGPQINTTDHEFNPSLSSDGLTLVFASLRGKSPSDLWMATRRSRAESFGPATLVAGGGNSTDTESGGALAVDGTILVVASTLSTGGTKENLRMAVRADRQAPFGKSVKLADDINSENSELHPWLTDDGLLLLYNELAPGDEVNLPAKIWAARRPSTDAPFGPRTLLRVRTPSPKRGAAHVGLTNDGKLLIFASSVPGDKNGRDLWATHRVPKTGAVSLLSAGGSGRSPDKGSLASSPPGIPRPGPLQVGEGAKAVDPERRVAEWVLGRNGEVGICYSGGERKLTNLADLPNEPFVVLSISRPEVKAPITSEEWQSLGALRAVSSMDFSGCNPTDEALTAMARCRTLRYVTIAFDDTYGDAGLAEIAKLPRLGSLDIGNCAMTAAGLEHLGKLTRLRALKLASTPKLEITSLAPLAGLKSLELLELNSTTAGDAAVADLANFPRLKHLNVARTRVTSAAIDSLLRCTNLRVVTLQGVRLTTESLRKLAAHPTLSVVNVNGTGLKPEEYKQLAAALPRITLLHPDLQAAYAEELTAADWAPTIGTISTGHYPGLRDANAVFGFDTNVQVQKPVAAEELRRLAALKNVTTLGFTSKGTPDQVRIALQALREHPNLASFMPSGVAGLSAADLKELPRHTDLRTVTFGYSNATTDETLAVLASLPDLIVFNVDSAQITDKVFEHLAKMPALRTLTLVSAKINGSGMSSLRNAPRLAYLRIGKTGIVDASLPPLAAMPELEQLYLDSTPITDAGLVHLEGCRELRILNVQKTKVTAAGVAKLHEALPDCLILWDGPTPTQAAVAPKNTTLADPEFQAWLNATQVLPAEKQLEAVSKKLMELNPGFDGKLTGIELRPEPKIENGVVTELGFICVDVTDLSPVRALPGLKALYFVGVGSKRGKVTDLSPLQGMQLSALCCTGADLSDLTPLEGMPLTSLMCAATRVESLAPLHGAPLTRLLCKSTKITDLSPLAGMPLKTLECNGLVADISPLAGMPLETLWIEQTQATDLTPLENCRSLKSLKVSAKRITVEQTAALQKSLPNCKIERIEPKPTSQPAK